MSMAKAIFGTRRWEKDCQWSEGDIYEYSKQEFHHGVPDPILEMAIKPKPGQARKECYFTKKDDTLYALIPVLPESGVFYLNDVNLSKDSEIRMLGVPGDLDYKVHSNQIEIKLPKLNPSNAPCNHVFVLRISHAQ